ncbi:Rod shape-determining protein MreC [hydrothermal vent metagenome]|uniref:Cell shape-determining protein MreC n=1 Tax=hydrothermal vent metagenome TaxID=652676 RepID=A0A1W1D2W5_9ZZZZ
MNKRGFFSIIFSIALLMSAIYYSNTIQQPILNSLLFIKIQYHKILSNIKNEINIHFSQAQKIQTLEKELQNYKKDKLLLIGLKSELKNLIEENKSTLKIDPKVELVRAISYERFGNLNRIWLEVEDYNSSKIYGLTYNDYVAGIVINYKNKPLALLNKDIKSTYAVSIGKSKAPGIAHGNNGENIIIKFIPEWFNIKIGDEVITSGLDNIFFQGLKVGKVISIISSQGYKNATVKPYFQENELNYFHMILQTK